MKKLVSFTLLVFFLLSGCSATPTSNPKSVSTPIKAVKTFFRALTTGDETLLNTVLYHTQSMPSNEIMKIAKMKKKKRPSHCFNRWQQ